MTFTIVFFGWIFSLCLHEFSHALVAYLGGDYTVREKIQPKKTMVKVMIVCQAIFLQWL